MIKLTFTFFFAISLSASSGAEVDAAMQALRQAMLRSDGVALERLYGERLMYSHSDGRLETKADAVAAASKSNAPSSPFQTSRQRSTATWPWCVAM